MTWPRRLLAALADSTPAFSGGPMPDPEPVIDEETCPVCGKSLYSHEVASYSLVYWDADPDDPGNSLIQMFCSIDHLKEWAALSCSSGSDRGATK